MVTLPLLAAVKEKHLQYIDHPKKDFKARCHIYISSEYRNLLHTIPLTISSNLF